MNADHAEGSSCGRGQMFELPGEHLLISAVHRGRRPRVMMNDELGHTEPTAEGGEGRRI